MGLAAGPQGGARCRQVAPHPHKEMPAYDPHSFAPAHKTKAVSGSAPAPMPSAAALQAVGGSRQDIAGAPSSSRRGAERQGIKVLGEHNAGSSKSVQQVVFGVDYTVGCEKPATGVHKRSSEIWEVFNAWETGQVSAEAMIRILGNMKVPVNARAKNAICTDASLNFQQLLFMLNEYQLNENEAMGLPSAPGIDIRGNKKPAHQSQVALGAFQRQRADEFTTNVIVPNFRPSRSNKASAANPLAMDGRDRYVQAQREPQDNREKAQELVRQYTEGAIKGDVFAKELGGLGIDAREGTEIARLQQRMERGDERVGFRAFNKAIQMQLN